MTLEEKKLLWAKAWCEAGYLSVAEYLKLVEESKKEKKDD
jgi:hypothetical protein